MFDYLSSGPEAYESGNYVVLDFETDTSHGDFGHPVHPDNGLLLACWKPGPKHPASRAGRHTRRVWTGEYDAGMQSLIEVLEDADFIVAHNAKYELGWLARAGMDVGKALVFDTKIAEYVLLGNLAASDKHGWRKVSTSLDDCVKRRGGTQKDPVVDILIKHGVNPLEIPRPWLEGRCVKDVEDTEWLFKHQRARLKRSNRIGCLYTRCALTPVLATTELEGMALDAERVAATVEEYRERYLALNAQMEVMTGGINWKSVPQMATFLYETLGFDELRRKDGTPIRNKKTKQFPEGAPKTGQEVIDKLAVTTPAQRAFKALREEIGQVNAALTKNLEYFAGVCAEKGSIMYAQFNQTTTATHRLSSSGIKTEFEMFEKPKSVQFQNMPRIFKPLIRAKREGWLIGEWDGSQLEFRAAVELSGDKQGNKDIATHWDVHKYTASVLFGVEVDNVTKAQRQAAKEHTFKPVYGGEKGTPEEEAYYAAFRQRYSGLAKTQESWVREVLKSDPQTLVTPWGLRFYWPHAKMNKWGRCNVRTSIYNYPVQCFATAEVIPIAMTHFWHLIRKEGLQDRIVLVNTVHDSVIAEVRPDAVADFRRLAVEVWKLTYRYLERVYGMKIEVTFGTEVTIGTHWADSKATATKYDIHPNGKVEEIA